MQKAHPSHRRVRLSSSAPKHTTGRLPRQWTGYVQATPPPGPEYAAASLPPTPPPPPVPPSAGVSDELLKLADLHDKGILSDTEFETAKRRVLGA